MLLETTWEINFFFSVRIIMAKRLPWMYDHHTAEDRAEWIKGCPNGSGKILTERHFTRELSIDIDDFRKIITWGDLENFRTRGEGDEDLQDLANAYELNVVRGYRIFLPHGVFPRKVLLLCPVKHD